MKCTVPDHTRKIQCVCGFIVNYAFVEYIIKWIVDCVLKHSQQMLIFSVSKLIQGGSLIIVGPAQYTHRNTEIKQSKREREREKM